MGNCKGRHGKAINPGSALDRVISQASSDDCVLYRLADYKKGGRLLEEYLRGGGREVERLVMEEFGVFMYNNGKGMQITRTEYLKWKYRHVAKDQMVVHMDTKSPFDPLKKWQDHEACWQMAFRGSLGESLLHVLIMCDTKAHTRIAKILLKCFPKLALDVVEGEEYLGASSLHLAIAYSNNDLVNILVHCGANINQRAIGSFFLPKDQQVVNPPGPEYTDYEGLAYLGEYPLAWAACLGNETVYNRLLDHGASPNLQDSFGNMILHMVVVCNQLGMFGYALRHPRLPAQDGIVNAANLTPLTLACKLARSTIFKEMLELTCIEFWRYSNITCSAYPLNALDTIKPNGETNFNSALMIILNGTKSEHLDMLEGGIIQRLLEEKWKTFARNQFLKRLAIMLLQLFTMSVILYLRPCYCGPKGMHLEDPSIRKMLWDDFFDTDATSIIRYCFEVIVLLEVLHYVMIQQVEEIMNQGLTSFLKGLAGNAPKAIFFVANILLLLCVPCRISYFFSPNLDLQARSWEDELMAYGAAGSWFMMLFFAGALKLTGPFVVMIYKMITGDMFTFSIIYSVMLLGFTQAFYFLYKRTAIPDVKSKFVTYRTTWMALFHMTLGEYDFSGMNLNIYVGMTKFVFLVFTIMLPIMLLNMLIAMMGNTYSTVISMSEKEWVKAWAKIVIALERAVSQEKLKDYLYTYSVPLGSSADGEDYLGVMVIKSANKTKAKQRKGALSNWKRVGRVTIDALKRRGVSGEFLRREMWGLQTAASTPIHGIRKKGGEGAYDVKAGIASTAGALDPEIWEEEEEPHEYFDGDNHDGIGALTGALDQLTFATDVNGSKDDDDETMPVARRPELVSAEASNKQLQAARKELEEKRAKKRQEEIDNPAFVDDEEFLLAAGITPDQDDDSDDNDTAKVKNKTPKVIVKNISYLDEVKTIDTKGSAILPPIVPPRSRPSSVKLRRLGSARRRAPPRYGMAFTEGPSSRHRHSKSPKVSPAAPVVCSNGTIPHKEPERAIVSNGAIPGKELDRAKVNKQATLSKSLSSVETTEVMEHEKRDETVMQEEVVKSEETVKEDGKDTAKDDGVEKKYEQSATDVKMVTDTDTVKDDENTMENSNDTDNDNAMENENITDAENVNHEEDEEENEDLRIAHSLIRSKTEDLSKRKDSKDDDSESKWAEKKPRKKNNKVGPSMSHDETAAAKSRANPADDSGIGLQSGTDSTRQEVQEKDRRERPKTGIAEQKIKNRSTENITNMSSILPWDNEAGDIV